MNSTLRPRYDRIVSLALLVLIGLTVVFLIDINPSNFRARLGGDLPAITLSWLLIASLVLITSTGTDIIIRSHPEMQTRTLPTINLGFVRIEIAPGFWILPSFAIIAPFALFRLFSNSLGTLAGILAVTLSGGLLLGAMIGQHYALDRRPETRNPARLGLQAIVLLLAFGVFSAIYYARLRWLYSATLVGVSGALLAFALLQWTPRRGSLPLLATIVGITLAEATWALNYWAAPFLLGGVLLLAIFHVVTGLLQSHLEGGLTRRLILEYSLIGSSLLAAVVFVAFR
jgi:Protein of unknown function (DUF5656)